MNDKKKILAICGSTQKESSNRYLLNAIKREIADRADLEIFESIDLLPHYNPDLDKDETVPNVVEKYRADINQADAVLICTPEYAMGVPGSLKNAIDWTVSSGTLYHKPLGLITASSLGQKAHPALMETLYVIEAKVTDKTHTIVSGIRSKIGPDSQFKDPEVEQRVMNLVSELIKLCNA